MGLFLTVLEGASPTDAQTIFATTDRKIIRALAAEISRRLGTKSQSKRPVEALRLVRKEADDQATT